MLDYNFSTGYQCLVHLLFIFCEHCEFVANKILLFVSSISERDNPTFGETIGSELIFGNEMYGEGKFSALERIPQFGFIVSNRGSA